MDALSRLGFMGTTKKSSNHKKDNKRTKASDSIPFPRFDLA